MNEIQLKILRSLKRACDDDVVRNSGDVRLKAHVADIGQLASYLLTELEDVPELRQRAVAEFASLADKADKLLPAGHNKSPAAQRFGAVDHASTTVDLCLAMACDLRSSLAGSNSPDATDLKKRLALAEGELGQRTLTALTTKATAGSDKVTDAGQTREFDSNRLAGFILGAFPDETDLRVEEMKFISGGSSKYTMGIRLGGARELPSELVLRGDSSSSAGYGGASVVDEYRLLQIMHARGVCVAKPLALESSGRVFGSPFMLVERRPGTMIGHMFHMPPPNRNTCRDIAIKLAALHSVAAEDIGDWIRGAKASTSEQVLATVEQSRANWEALQRPSPLFDAAFEWLRKNVAVMDRSRGLVHGDYGLNNILIHNEEVSAILDWEFAHIGNPAYDLGYFRYMADALGSWQEFLDAYQQAGGRVFTPEELNYSILFAVTRLGVMVCQAEAAYHAGITDGLFLALTFGRGCHNQSLQRMHAILENLL